VSRMNTQQRCPECGRDFGHDEGCSHVGDAMKRDALLNGKSVPVKTVQQSDAQRYYDALKHIATAYESAERVKQVAEKRYGLTGDEALEMAYDNIQQEAKQAIRGKRRPA
jgi:hypothetical protein